MYEKREETEQLCFQLQAVHFTTRSNVATLATVHRRAHPKTCNLPARCKGGNLKEYQVACSAKR